MALNQNQRTFASAVVILGMGLAGCSAQGTADRLEEEVQVGVTSEALRAGREIACPGCLLVGGNDNLQSRLTTNCPRARGWKYLALVRLDTLETIPFVGDVKLQCNKLDRYELTRPIPVSWVGQDIAIVFKKGNLIRRTESLSVRDPGIRGGGVILCPTCFANAEAFSVDAKLTTNCPVNGLGDDWEVACFWNYNTEEVQAFTEGQDVNCQVFTTYDLDEEIPSGWEGDDVYIELMNRNTGEFVGADLFTVDEPIN